MRVMHRSIYIGFDRRERDAFHVARASIQQNLSQSIPIHAVTFDDLSARGLYRRPTEWRNDHRYDMLSVRGDYDGVCSTDFALTRFFVPLLARKGLALFMDCDILARADVVELFRHCEEANPDKALWCVKHDYRPAESQKMDGQSQTSYPRKNWSSVMMFNCGHPANRSLSLDYLNSATGRDLHAMSWLADCDIGGLDDRGNALVGHSKVSDPALAHFTLGTPDMPGYERCDYADEWFAVRDRLQ